MPPPPSAAGPPPGSEEPPPPPELPVTPPSWPGPDRLGLGRFGLGRFGLDRLGLTQAIGGLALGLIALFSSYDHLTIAGRTIPIPQQWGIPLIAASVAIVFVDAELASGSRLRAADEQQSDRDRAEQRENEADRERNRAAEARERQTENLECIRQAAVLSARVQLDPTDINRARLQTFLNLLTQTSLDNSDP